MNIYERFALNTAARTARGCDWLTGERLDIMAARKKADSYAADKKALDEYRSLPKGDAEVILAECPDQVSVPESATDNMGFGELDLSPFGPGPEDIDGPPVLSDPELPKEEPGSAAQESTDAASSTSAAASSPASVPKRARRPLLSSEVNKAERKLLSFEDRKRSFHDTAQRHAAQVDSEQVAFIEALPDAVRTSLKLMGLIQA